jgi:phenylalanyl-tRNA synthetase beta chain
VLTAEKHPQADKLQVLTVDAGEGPVQVVCGAPNARAGMLGVFGAPGAYIPGSDLTLKVAAIRGVESRGMMCSARELQLGEDHSGIIELPDDAPVGAAYTHYAGLGDPVFDVNVTPNRPDCMGVRGIARDLAAAGVGTLKPQMFDAVTGGFDNPVAITVEAGSGCEAFAGRLIRGVRNGPSPDWLRQRLKAVGLRPISALVDITNFFSVDQARPLHVYDAGKLQGGIVARLGRGGERFLALNDKEYTTAPEDCVIADERGAIGLGGVVGGESTGVDEQTSDVLLECAWFDPQRIAATGRRHQIITDARARFERGVDPAGAGAMVEAATRMILDCAAAKHRRDLCPDAELAADRGARLVRSATPGEALAGIDVPSAEQHDILSRLGFRSKRRSGAARLAPGYRWRGRSGRGSRPNPRLRQGAGSPARALARAWPSRPRPARS